MSKDAGALRLVETDQPASYRSAGLAEAVNAERTRPWILRRSAPPYLLAGDVAANLISRVTTTSLVQSLAALVIFVLLAQYAGLYRSRLTFSLLDDLPALVLCGVSSSAISQWGLSKSGQLRISEIWFETLLAIVALLAVRATAYYTIRWGRCSGRVRHTAIILGAGHVGIQLAESLKEHRELGLDVVGLLDSRPRTEMGKDLPAPLLGDYSALTELIEDFVVKVVIVAFGGLRESDLVEVLRTCDRLQCEIMFVPRLYEMHAVTRGMDAIHGVPLVRVHRAAFRQFSWRLKRVTDFVLSGIACVALLPLMALIALAVRLESGPGFLFRQERVGLDSRPFMLLKFRSMRPATAEESSKTWNISQDDRIGSVGRALRRTSLDELPQLWNVLRGDMSLVGPRPERQHFVDEFSTYVPRYTARHRVPAGLTGWAQVNGLRGDTSIKDRASYDNYYIENWSLWLDVKIMIRTVKQVLARAGG